MAYGTTPHMGFRRQFEERVLGSTIFSFDGRAIDGSPFHYCHWSPFCYYFTVSLVPAAMCTTGDSLLL